ncbi:hypothetical protein SETIT_2G285300v2 [Setaria italica]|uniref:Uncharacterized protein n=1 Tax=Setaria italica TaxID=4555 RepID=A0A368Q5W3_SETIT|nr:hypothetical protein SETIT_2G285300v2 [Setaria italica]
MTHLFVPGAAKLQKPKQASRRASSPEDSCKAGTEGVATLSSSCGNRHTTSSSRTRGGNHGGGRRGGDGRGGGRGQSIFDDAPTTRSGLHFHGPLTCHSAIEAEEQFPT